MEELLEEIKGLRSDITRGVDRVAGSMDKIAAVMGEWWRRENDLVDYAADERIERMGETEGTLDEYVVAGGSGESGEQSGEKSADLSAAALFLPEPMDL